MSTAVLDVMHMALLGSLLPDRPIELGPAPVELPPDPSVRSTVLAQLSVGAGAGLVDQDGTALTDVGRELLLPLVSYDEAYWGMIVTHNERQPVTLQVPDEWLEYIGDALQTAAMASPRTYVLITRRGATATAAVRHHDRIDISQFTIPRGLPIAVADYILGLADPHKQWAPLNMPPVSFPYAALSKYPPPPRPPASDSPARQQTEHRRYAARFVQSLRTEYRLPPKAAAALSQLLTLDHVATTQLMYSQGDRKLTSDHSVAIDYFHNAGMTVTRPRRIGDRSWWKHISPATHSAVAEALAALPQLPLSERGFIASAIAHNPPATSVFPPNTAPPA